MIIHRKEYDMAGNLQVWVENDGKVEIMSIKSMKLSDDDKVLTDEARLAAESEALKGVKDADIESIVQPVYEKRAEMKIADEAAAAEKEAIEAEKESILKDAGFYEDK